MKASISTAIWLLTSLVSALASDGNDQSIISSPVLGADIGDTIHDILVENQIIGDVLNEFQPLYALNITFRKKHEQVKLGNDIPVKAVKKQPLVAAFALPGIPAPPTNAVYTIALTDPDAKSRANPKWSEMCHWLITNITGTTSEGMLSIDLSGKSKPAELWSYRKPAPPPKTGPHRYVFVLLQGNSTQLKAPAERRHWGYGEPRRGVRDWALENNLTVVGVNFFFAKNKKQ